MRPPLTDDQFSALIFRNLSLKNIDNPVIRVLIHGGGGKQMLAALEFLKRLQEFEGEEQNETWADKG